MKQTLNKQRFEVNISFYLLVHINKYAITISAYAVKYALIVSAYAL